MILALFASTLDQMEEQGIAPEAMKAGKGYSRGEDVVKLNVEMYPVEDLTKILEFLRLEPKNVRKARAANIVENWLEIKRNPAGKGVTSINQLKGALREFLAVSPRHMVFQMGGDKLMEPYVVTDISYNEPTDEHPASVELTLAYYKSGKRSSTTETFYHTDVVKKSLSEVLAGRGIFMATDKLIADSEEDFVRYQEIYTRIGLQLVGTGWGHRGGENYWGRGVVSLEKDGEPSRLVVDTEAPEGGAESPEIANMFWVDGTRGFKQTRGTRGYRSSVEADAVKDPEIVKLPFHAYVKCFDLIQHVEVSVQVRNLELYQYNPELREKLVLPGEVREVVEILVGHSALHLSDIISGKTGGANLLISGPAGVGKTLTAEVYSEVIKRPLYSVQCSQLGTDEVKLEAKLKEVLKRASRWGAILLIDEADVYIRNRGTDIQQNAIVGVFLRVLEYYPGIIFMTTNIELGNIDDAIISRATALLEYKVPTPTDLRKIWGVLASSFGSGLSEEQLDDIAARLPGITGRDVKNLLKLAMMIAYGRHTKVTPDVILGVSKFKLLQSRASKLLEWTANRGL